MTQPQRKTHPQRPPAALAVPRSVWESIPLPTAFDQPARFDFRTGLPDGALFPTAAGDG
jgi:hypothetical protein